MQASGRIPRNRQAGYNLVALVILVTVMNVLIAAALPVWSQQIQREKEEELIFRGLQYAEAIRIFQLRHGRYPTRLEELMETNPRSIRRLWTDPMRQEGEEQGEDGEELGTWGLLFAQQTGGQQPAQGGDGRTQQSPIETDQQSDEESAGQSVSQPPGRQQTGTAQRRLGEGTVTIGPIIGVHSLANGNAIKSFGDSRNYNTWHFRADILPALPATIGATGAPSLNSRWVGRPFPADLGPQEGDAPKDLIPTQDEPAEEESTRRRPRRRGGN